MSRHRRIRLHDLIQRLGGEPEFERSYSSDGYHDRDTFGRVVKKKYLQQICRLLDCDDDGVVVDLRKRIRRESEYMDSDRSAQFTVRELRRLNGMVEDIIRHDFNDAYQELFDDAPWHMAYVPPGTELDINGESYTVDTMERHRATADAPYAGWIEIHLGDNKRLMLLESLDMDKCRYRGPVTVEKRVNHEPYHKWDKREYVRRLECDIERSSLYERLCELEIDDEIKFDSPRLWLRITDFGYVGNTLIITLRSSRNSQYRAKCNYMSDQMYLYRTSDSEGYGIKTEFDVR